MHLSKANAPATGLPEISGAARVGGTLRVSTAAIADSDGLDGAQFSYRWTRLDGETATVVGTDATSYTAVAADAGKRIVVEVSFTDGLGFAETRESLPVTIRPAAEIGTCSAPELGSRGERQIWTGEVTVGAQSFQGTTVAYGFSEAAPPLAATGDLSDKDFTTGEDNDYTVRSSTVSVGGSLVFSVDRALVDSEVEHMLLFVCGEAFGFGEASHDPGTGRYTWPAAGLDWSGVTKRSLRLRAPTDIRAPRLVTSGNAQPEAKTPEVIEFRFDEALDTENLPANEALMVEVNGHPFSVDLVRLASSTTFQVRSSRRIYSGDTVRLIYTDPTPADDENAFQDEAGNDVASFNVHVVNRVVFGPLLGVPTITGPPGVDLIFGLREGHTLRALPRTISDPDGLTGATYSYQWIRDGEDIDGATGPTYTVAEADVGNQLQVRASFFDDIGSPETRLSTQTGPVGGVAPKITIEADRPKATGRFDVVGYRLAREGSTASALTVTVTLEPPAATTGGSRRSTSPAT